MRIASSRRTLVALALSFRVGRVNRKDVFERKTAVLGESVLTLSPASTGWIELRVARVGRPLKKDVLAGKKLTTKLFRFLTRA